MKSVAGKYMGRPLRGIVVQLQQPTSATEKAASALVAALKSEQLAAKIEEPRHRRNWRLR